MIRDYYHIDSKRLGLLQTSFIISYMCLSPVFGYLGDRWKRKYLMIIGLSVWTLFAFVSSFVPSDRFGLFLFLRCVVGVGEASYSTLAPTILTDLFVGNTRTSVLGIFYFAVPVGSGLGFILGSTIANATGNWAWSLRITPLLGLFCVVALGIFHTDPLRGRADGAFHLHTTSWFADLKSLSSNRCFLLLSLGFTGNCFVLGSLSWFSVDYIQDALNARISGSAAVYPVALLFGLSACFAGLFGVIVGTMMAKRLRVYSVCVDTYICGGGLLTSSPFIFAGLVFPMYNFYLCVASVFIGQFFMCLNWALISDMTMSVVVPTRRATANAFQMLVTHALGDAISPLVIGLIADSQTVPNSLYSRYLGMQRALLINVYICIISGFLFLCASWYLESAKASVQFIIDASRVEQFDVYESEVHSDHQRCLSGPSYGSTFQTTPFLSFASHQSTVA
nr:protein spinster [Hymenolepis microstoma]